MAYDTDSFNGISDGNRSSGIIPDSVKLAKRFNAADRFRRALLDPRSFCPVLAETSSAWASSNGRS